jgi:hypothetical protein
VTERERTRLAALLVKERRAMAGTIVVGYSRIDGHRYELVLPSRRPRRSGDDVIRRGGGR